MGQNWIGNFVATVKPFDNIMVITAGQAKSGEGVVGSPCPNERIIAATNKPIMAQSFAVARRLFERSCSDILVAAEAEGDVEVYGIEVIATDR